MSFKKWLFHKTRQTLRRVKTGLKNWFTTRKEMGVGVVFVIFSVLMMVVPLVESVEMSLWDLVTIALVLIFGFLLILHSRYRNEIEAKRALRRLKYEARRSEKRRKEMEMLRKTKENTSPQ